MPVATLLQTGVAFPIVSDNQRSRLNGALHKSAQRLGATVWHDGKPDAPCIASPFPLIELGAWFALAYINCCHHQGHVMNTAAFAPRAPTDEGLIDFHMLYRTAANAILIGTHHASAKFMQKRECGLIPG